jgi:hypothetical protein
LFRVAQELRSLGFTLGQCATEPIEKMIDVHKGLFRGSSRGGGRNPALDDVRTQDRLLTLPRLQRFEVDEFSEHNSTVAISRRAAQGAARAVAGEVKQSDGGADPERAQAADGGERADAAEGHALDAVAAAEPSADAAAADAAASAERALDEAAEFAELADEGGWDAAERSEQKQAAAAASAADVVGSSAPASVSIKLPPCIADLASLRIGGSDVAGSALQLRSYQHSHMIKLFANAEKWMQLRWENIRSFVEPVAPAAAAAEGKEAKQAAAAAPAPRTLCFDVCMPPDFKVKDGGKTSAALDFTPAAVAHAQPRYELTFRSAALRTAAVSMLATNPRLAKLLQRPLPASSVPAAFDKNELAANSVVDNPQKQIPLGSDAVGVQRRCLLLVDRFRRRDYDRPCFRCGGCFPWSTSTLRAPRRCRLTSPARSGSA